MRCGCAVCGEYMVQEERGLHSRCICPNCFATCSACMGTRQQPASREELTELLRLRRLEDGNAGDAGNDGDGEAYGPERGW